MVRTPLVLRHRLAVVDRLVVRLDIGVVAPVLEAAIVQREVGRMAALMRHLRRVCLGADLALRLVVSLGGRRVNRRRRSLGLRWRGRGLR